MLAMKHHIEFITEGKTYVLRAIYSCKIEESVEQLTDTAEIFLPEKVRNQPFNLENKIKYGSEVLIQLGYNESLRTEFVGYVNDIRIIDGTMKIMCEDALFIFRKDVPDTQLKATSNSKIAQYLIDNVDPSFMVDCDYDIGFETFVIHQATAFDVLKKLSEETKANIYFDSSNKVLHIHSPYLQKGGDVTYSMDRNIEKSNLEYVQAKDRKAEITVESTDAQGRVKSVTAGTTGGDKITIKTSGMSEADMKKVADSELIKHSADRYNGTFDGWLIPFVKSGYSAKIKDPDYPDRDHRYFVSRVSTDFSQSGGVRTITPSIRL